MKWLYKKIRNILLRSKRIKKRIPFTYMNTPQLIGNYQKRNKYIE